MRHVDESKFEVADPVKPRREHGISGALQALGQRLRKVFKPRFDPTMLSAAQRRDVGISEDEVERFEVLRKPLIR